jgi:hypothetical protein
MEDEEVSHLGMRLLATLWGVITMEVRSPGFVAHAPVWVKRLEAEARANAA